MNEEVARYIAEAPLDQGETMEAIRKIIHREVPSVVENFKWGRPVFSTDSDFAYFKTTKSYLIFGVFKFDRIRTHRELLEGTGQDMRHIKIRKPGDLQPEIIKNWIKDITG